MARSDHRVVMTNITPYCVLKTIASLAVQFCRSSLRGNEAKARPSNSSVNEIHGSERSSSSTGVKRRSTKNDFVEKAVSASSQFSQLKLGVIY